MTFPSKQYKDTVFTHMVGLGRNNHFLLHWVANMSIISGNTKATSILQKTSRNAVWKEKLTGFYSSPTVRLFWSIVLWLASQETLLVGIYHLCHQMLAHTMTSSMLGLSLFNACLNWRGMPMFEPAGKLVTFDLKKIPLLKPSYILKLLIPKTLYTKIFEKSSVDTVWK